LFSFITSRFGVVASQLLDGVAESIFGMISINIASDPTQGTGRFNLAQGLAAHTVGIGAGLSNLVVQCFVDQGFGCPAGLRTLAPISGEAPAFFAPFMLALG
jgi:hypothetical protein